MHLRSLADQEMPEYGLRALFLRYDEEPCTPLVQHESLRESEQSCGALSPASECEQATLITGVQIPRSTVWAGRCVLSSAGSRPSSFPPPPSHARRDGVWESSALLNAHHDRNR